MKPAKIPEKREKIIQEKRKRRGGEQAKKKFKTAVLR